MGELVTYKDAAAHLVGMVSGLSIRYDMGLASTRYWGCACRPIKKWP
jgi:hypothetical protein